VKKVALSGGIFMNVKANQVIAALPEVEDLFIFPSCGDETNAMGAAFACYAAGGREEENKSRAGRPSSFNAPIGPIYWGREASETEMRHALESATAEFNFERPTDIAQHAAGFLARGEVVARFAGRAEFGARALGNRSILGHPARSGVIKRINEMIKSRDFWMPFACSMLAERAGEYIVNEKGLRAPYMILTFPTTGKVEEIENGTHPYDRTVRPQIVERGWNADYHALIEAFAQATGIGALLNTSFNLHGHPIVDTPQEALDVMRKSGLKYLILGPYWVEKKAAE
jgi:carbamoyltransferase